MSSASAGVEPRTVVGLDSTILALGTVVVAGSVTAILDATIVNVAIPTLGHELGATVSQVQWVMTAYLLAFASVIPLTGWLTVRLGARPVWLLALVVFLSGSVLAGCAWSIWALVAFRVVQGLGGGLLMPVGQAILVRAAGRERMGRVMSVVGVPLLLAPVLGPVLGGAIVGSVSWRWIFFLNVPVGLLAIALSLRLLPRSPARGDAGLDVLGVALLPPGLALLVWGVSEAGTSGRLGNPSTLAGVGAGLALVLAFGWHSWRRGDRALVDVRVFRNRGFSAAAATTLLVGVGLFGALILLPLYFQLVRGLSPLETGLLLMPQGIGAAMALPIAGRLTDRVGARPVVVGGLAAAFVAMAAYTRVGAGTSYAFLAAALLVVGVGLGCTIVPSMAAAYASVPREAAGHATSLVNVVQRVAGSLGTALLAIVLQRRIAESLPGLSGGLETLGHPGAAAPEVAAAFGASFRVALVLIGVAVIPALLLPGRGAAPPNPQGLEAG